MSHLAVRLFGSFQATLDGQPLTAFATDKARALLAYLAVEDGRPHRRESLAAMFWPEHSTTAARNNLRQTLFRLRQAIGDVNHGKPHLLVTVHDVHFNPEGDHWLDIAEFSGHLEAWQTHHPQSPAPCASCEQRLANVIELYQGDFLAGFSLSDCPRFEWWLLAKQETCHRQTMEVLGYMGSYCEQSNDYDRAAEYAQKEIEMEPWRESAHQRLMYSLALSGHRHAALAQYERCRQLLRKELGVEASIRTTRLYEQIREGALGHGGRETEDLADTRDKDPDKRPTGKKKRRSQRIERAEAAEPELFTRVPKTPFVAFDAELDRLTARLKTILDGHGQVVFVTGEVGSGKTSLLAELAMRAMPAHPDLLVAAGSCDAYASRGIPYWSFQEALRMLSGQLAANRAWGSIYDAYAQRTQEAMPTVIRALVKDGPDLINGLLQEEMRAWSSQAGSGDSWRSQVSELIARYEKTAKPISSGTELTNQAALFDQMTLVLQTISRHHPLLLILDDLHWADRGTASLLFHLGRRLQGCRILIVGAYRPEAVALGSISQTTGLAERHPLMLVVNEFQRDWGNIYIELENTDSRAFLEAFLDLEPNRLDDRFRDTLYQLTGGNPLFVGELLQSMRERGQLVQEEADGWVAVPELDWDHLPLKIEAVIAERIDRLPPMCRTILETGCVQGRDFMAEIVAWIQESDEALITHLLSDLVSSKHHLIQAQGVQHIEGQRYSVYHFRHHLLQQFLYRKLDKIKRAWLHEATAKGLENAYGKLADDQAPLLAHHFESAGITDRAVDYLLTAGIKAYEDSASELSLVHLQKGLQLLSTLPPTRERDVLEMGLQLALDAPLRALHGQAAPAVGQACARARELADKTGDKERLFKATFLLWSFHFARARNSKALGLAQSLVNLAEENGHPRHLSDAHLAMGIVRFAIGQFSQARLQLESIVDGLEPQPPDDLISSIDRQDIQIGAHVVLSRVLWYLGYPDLALMRAEHILDQAKKLGHTYGFIYSLGMASCAIHLLRREHRLTEEQAEQLQQISSEQGHGHYQFWGQIFRGKAQVERGRKLEGESIVRQGLSHYRETGQKSNLTFLLGLAAQVYGKDEDKQRSLAEALALVEETSERYFEAELCRLKGDVMLRRDGHTSEAETCFKNAIKIAQAQEAKTLELRATSSLARLWKQQGKFAEAHKALSEIYNWFSEGFETSDLREARKLLDQIEAHLAS